MNIYIARQPIFDRQFNIIGYELLYRQKNKTTCEMSDGNMATLDVITGAFLFEDIDKMTHGKKAFINFTQSLIEYNIATLFPSEYLVVELLEDISASDNLISKCIELKKLGYTIAMDDFSYKKGCEKIIDIADIIKIDFLATPICGIENLIKQYKNKDNKFVAEKIETKEDLTAAIALGFDYFQGYYLDRPEIINTNKIKPIKSNYIRLMDVVLNSQVDFERISNIIENDVAFSFEILRIVNTLKYYRGNRIKSVKHALLIMGLYQVEKWIYITVIRKSFSGKSNEILIQSLIRAKFMESLAIESHHQRLAHDCFTIGIFSLIDILMGNPIQHIMDELPLSNDVKEVLITKYQSENHPQSNKQKVKDMKMIFKFVLDYERASWDNIDDYVKILKLDSNQIGKLYVDSLSWAYDIFEL